MRAIVCGGRAFDDPDLVDAILNDVAPHEIATGGATGADRLAARWAAAHRVPCEVYLAEWRTLGKRAGPIRNARMLVAFEPDLVIAFPGGSGTAHMVKIARAWRVEVFEVGASYKGWER